MTARLSASSLWRTELCPASAVLPHEKRTYRDAQAGTRAHAALEAAAPAGSFAEVAFVYNVLRGEAKEVGRSIGREYGNLEEGDIPGTADLVTVQPDHVLVDDYKTGHGYKVSRAAVNPQLQHNALCAALVYGKPRAIVQILFTKTGEVWDGEFDLFDFEAIRERLRSIWASTMDPDPAVVPDVNNQCWRCPAKKACPIMGRRAA